MLQLTLIVAVGVAVAWTRGYLRKLTMRAKGAAPFRHVTERSLARTATRSHPLLVLHSDHALLCWPAEAEPWSRGKGEPERLDWMVEIDGRETHAGPSSGVSSTHSEVAAGVRLWWDGLEMAAAVARGRSELRHSDDS